MKIGKGKKLLLLGVLLVVIDQVIKMLVKVNLPIGGGFHVIGNWFRILFIENEGMAFGMKFGGAVGKFLLTFFRLCLFGFLCWWITKLVRRDSDTCGASGGAADASGSPVQFRNATKGGASGGAADASGAADADDVPTGVLVGLTLIAAGAMGNILDCLFYGQLFSASDPVTTAVFGGSYAPVMFGKVVDMFYFPLIDTTWPSWVPWIGGTPLRFFEPVFNFADSCVTVGAVYLILFQWHFFAKEE